MSLSVLQMEYARLRVTGAAPLAALTEMIEWRRQSITDLCAVPGVWPRHITEEVARLNSEMTRAALTRRALVGH